MVLPKEGRFDQGHRDNEKDVSYIEGDGAVHEIKKTGSDFDKTCDLVDRIVKDNITKVNNVFIQFINKGSTADKMYITGIHMGVVLLVDAIRSSKVPLKDILE